MAVLSFPVILVGVFGLAGLLLVVILLVVLLPRREEDGPEAPPETDGRPEEGMRRTQDSITDPEVQSAIRRNGDGYTR